MPGIVVDHNAGAGLANQTHQQAEQAIIGIAERAQRATALAREAEDFELAKKERAANQQRAQAEHEARIAESRLRRQATSRSIEQQDADRAFLAQRVAANDPSADPAALQALSLEQLTQIDRLQKAQSQAAAGAELTAAKIEEAYALGAFGEPVDPAAAGDAESVAAAGGQIGGEAEQRRDFLLQQLEQNPLAYRDIDGSLNDLIDRHIELQAKAQRREEIAATYEPVINPMVVQDAKIYGTVARALNEYRSGTMTHGRFQEIMSRGQWLIDNPTEQIMQAALDEALTEYEAMQVARWARESVQKGMTDAEDAFSQYPTQIERKMRNLRDHRDEWGAEDVPGVPRPAPSLKGTPRPTKPAKHTLLENFVRAMQSRGGDGKAILDKLKSDGATEDQLRYAEWLIDNP